MKIILPILMLILMLSFVGCGGQSTSATLKVTNSMLLSNGGFTGGLLIEGQGPDQRKFIQFLPYTSGAPTEMNIVLPKGVWSFRAVGWTGTSNFNGSMKCASTTAKLESDKSAVEMQATAVNCDSTYGSAAYTNGTPDDFKSLNIVTCEQFNKSDGTKVLSPGDSTFCNSASALKTSVKKWAKSIRVATYKKGIGELPSLNIADSVCLTSGVDGLLFRTPSINLPTKSIPFHFDLYSSANCLGASNIIVSYPLLKGMEFDYLTEADALLKQDKVLIAGGSSNFLFLATNKIKRGTSSFLGNAPSLIPSINCSGLSCVPTPVMPTTPTGVKLVGKSGTKYLLRLTKTHLENCATFNWTANASLTSTDSDCREDDGGDDERNSISVEVKFIEANCTGGCTFQYKFGLGPLETIVVKTSLTDLNNIMEHLFGGLGHLMNAPIVLLDVNRNIHTLAQADSDYGRLSKVHEMFKANGPAGVIGEGVTCSTSMNVTDNITFFNEGGFRTYQVEVKGRLASGISYSMPNFTCDDGDSTPGTCPSAPANLYDAVMTVRKQDGPVWVAEAIMKFRCDKPVGELEFQEIEDGKTSKELLYWNTNMASTQRYEYYSFDEKNVSGILEKSNTEFERAEKIGTSEIRLSTSKFDTHLESGLYSQKVERQDSSINAGGFKLGSVKAYSRYEEALAPYAIFNDFLFAAENKKTILPNNATSPDGQQHIKAAFAGVDTKIYFLNPTFILSDTYTTSSSLKSGLKLSINNSGNAIVCWIEESGGVFNGYARSYNGTVWANFGSATADRTDYIDCKINELNDITVVSQRLISGPTTRIEINSGVHGGAVITDTLLPSTGFLHERFAMDILSNGLIGLAFVEKNGATNRLHYGSVLSGFFSAQGGTPTVMPSSTLFSGIEFTKTLATDPRITFSWSQSTSNLIDVWKLSAGALVQDAQYDSAGGTVSIPQFSPGSYECANYTAPFELDEVTNILSNCPLIFTGNFAPAVKTQYVFDLKSMNPLTLKNAFTPNATFITN